MYPDWPKSDADMVPLPECPGPKLQPFDFQGPQKIEFLEILGEGSHAIVAKVRILGHIYALKMVSTAPCKPGRVTELSPTVPMGVRP